MSGLGIVLEDRVRLPVLRNPISHTLSEPAMALENSQSPLNFGPDEMLLPPLPVTDDSDLLGAPRADLGPGLNSGFGSGFSTLEAMPSAASGPTPSGLSTSAMHGDITPYSETSKNSNSDSFFFVPELYALDSLALNIDTPPIAFPEMELLEKSLPKSNLSTTVLLHNVPSLAPSSQGLQPTNTLPLRRLKSLKNGIRKLSLSRMGSFPLLALNPEKSEKPAKEELPVRPQFPLFTQHSQNSQTSQNSQNSQPTHFPLFSPTASEFAHADALLLSSGAESVKSTFSNMVHPAAFGPGHVNSFSTTASSPLGPMHNHTSSSGLNQSGNGNRTRRRTISTLNGGTPLPQPIVTLSENLASTKKNITSIEQSFFEHWGGSQGQGPNGPNLNSGNISSRLLSVSQPYGTGNGLLSHLGSKSEPQEFETGSNNMPAGVLESTDLAALNTPDDLVEYLVYLSEHKRSVEMAYEVSKDRLVSSGWCSGHDIENLNLQRDSSLSQIDSKLLKIEAKLNSEFNVSFLHAKGAMQHLTPRQKCAPSEALSPSLKDLENKCLYFSAEHGNICQ